MERHIPAILAKAVLAISLLAGYTSTQAQEYDSTPVTVSKEKIKRDGKVFYSHIVLEKQTLYSISKAYDVSIEDLYKYNPTLKEEGLKKNSIIIIPALTEEEEAEVTAPVEEITEKPEQEKIIHTVKWFEDLTVIAGKYGVTVESIMKANGLKGRKLSRRQKLMIPSPEEIVETVDADTEELAQIDSTAVSDTVEKDERALFPGLFSPKKDVNVSLMLPFKADGQTSSRSNMDFYSGVLLAIYDLGNEGIGTDLNVYDIAGAFPAENPELEKSDIIIGPVSSENISRFYESMPKVKALISPLDQRAAPLAYIHKNLTQAPTPHEIQYQDLLSWIREDLKADDRLLVISEKGAVQTQAVQEMKAAVDSSGLEYIPLEYSILEGRNVTESLEYLMSETASNRVFITSESEAFVNDVVRNLNIMIHKKYDVVLYAASRIRSFETIDVANLHNASTHVSLCYYIDYEDAKVKDFLLRYRALFNTEPSQSAFQGYDIAKYFIGICSKYGNRWQERIDDADMEMLQNTFRFRDAGEGGHINTGVRRIIYSDNWSVIKVR